MVSVVASKDSLAPAASVIDGGLLPRLVELCVLDLLDIKFSTISSPVCNRGNLVIFSPVVADVLLLLCEQGPDCCPETRTLAPASV